ncbi:uncharacterized protein DUF3816 [Entomoplasma freundtii]|uniref:Uncharacterized protein n=1 Tax=Entomoplasma freundtii TaxID=74700 RepID=A0A2K8NRV2_9MOLU|nr:ECF transporter S component [Entomoplasma freundtii]ATZ16575.1 hypothetical protein EFREU_v1c05540 [Entomoplasma freundtii]TDY58259.1 uncharacterized protein DUF3816 [Entomoplasma freundtii]
MKKDKNAKEMFSSMKRDFHRTHHENEADHGNDHKDHYHGKIHYDKSGHADKIDPNEFKAKTYFKYTKKNLTFKIAASGVVLALSVAVSALDIVFESFLMFPIGQVYISFRFLDTIVLLIGLPVLGPIFGSLVGLLEPIFHNLIHGMEHGWIQPLTDSLTNVIIIFLTWAIYYLLFRNSPYHRDPNKKKDWLKRITPAFILSVLAALIATASLFLALYIQSKTGWGIHDHDHDHAHHFSDLLQHHDHDHGGKPSVGWSNITSNVAYFFFAIFGINLLRYAIAYSLFVVIEGRLRPLNHRYR